MLNHLKQQPIVSRVVLACQIALMPSARFDAMINHLEANAKGGPERAAYFQEVVSLARLCRTRGPLATLFTKRAAVVKSLSNAYATSLVLWQMTQLGR